MDVRRNMKRRKPSEVCLQYIEERRDPTWIYQKYISRYKGKDFWKIQLFTLKIMNYCVPLIVLHS